MNLIFLCLFIFFSIFSLHEKATGVPFVLVHEIKRVKINPPQARDIGIIGDLLDREKKVFIINDICLPSTPYILSDLIQVI